MKKEEKSYSPLKNTDIKKGDIVYIIPSDRENNPYASSLAAIGLSGFNEQPVVIDSVSIQRTSRNTTRRRGGGLVATVSEGRSVPTFDNNDGIITVSYSYKQKSFSDFISHNKKEKVHTSSASFLTEGENFVKVDDYHKDPRVIERKRLLDSIKIVPGSTKFFLKNNRGAERGYREEFIVEEEIRVSPTSLWVKFRFKDKSPHVLSVDEVSFTQYENEEDIIFDNDVRISIQFDGKGGSFKAKELSIVDGYITDFDGTFAINTESELGKKILKQIKER